MGGFYWKKLIKKDKFFLYAIPIALIVNYIALSKLFAFEGWPVNHETDSFKGRMLVYIAHLSAGDIFPFWSIAPKYSSGMGMPLPLFYHKLFYYVSSFWFIIIYNAKISIALTIVTFNLVGIVGIYKIGRLFTFSRALSFILSLSILFFNYTLTNWWIRGAMAEYSAMMLVPWLLWWIVNLTIHEKYSRSLPIIFVLLYFGHSIIAFYAVFAVFIAYIFYFSRNYSKENFIKHIKKNIISLLIFIIPVSFHIIPMRMLSPFYDVSTIKSNNYVPWHQYKEFQQYFIDRFHLQFKYTVQLDHIVIASILIAVALSYLVLKRYKIDIKSLIHSIHFKCFLVLLSLFLFYFLLQLPLSKFFYRNVPGADYIQFPWRLLSFIQFLLLILVYPFLKFLLKFNEKIASLSIATFLLFISIMNYPLWRIKAKDVVHIEKKVFEDLNDIKLFGLGEYLPVATGINFWSKPSYCYFFKQKGIEVKDSYCMIHEIKPESVEYLYTDFEVNNANDSSIVILPYNFSGFERVFLVNGNKDLEIKKFRRSFDPRLHLILPKGAYIFRLKFACFSNFFVKNTTIDPLPSDDFKYISCSAEEKFQPIHKSFLMSDNNMPLFEAGQRQDSTLARTGKYSVKTIPKDINGFWYVMRNFKKGETWQASVWRYGDKGHLKAFSRYLNVETNQAIEKDSAGWEKLVIQFQVGHENEGEVIVTAQNKTQGDIFFDDIEIKRID